MGIQTSLDDVRATTRLVDAMRAADDLAFVASRNSGVRTTRVLSAAIGGDDQLTAIAAVHALGRVFDESAEQVLVDLLSHDRAFIREHASWALGARLPRVDAVAQMIETAVAGGFAGMLAQRTLQQWGTAAPDVIAVAIEAALVGVVDLHARARLVETLGVVPTRVSTRVLLRVARAAREDQVVRVAAVAALGDRAGDATTVAALSELAAGAGYLSTVARLAIVDLTASAPEPSSWRPGLTVAQLFLHADIDPQLSQAGRGDNGGIATLLVRLGDALARDTAPTAHPIARVITLSRGSAEQAMDSLHDAASNELGHIYGAVPLLSEPVPAPAAWPLRIAAERGIRRILRAAGDVHALHLRMADVGSLAAANVARDLGIPMVFTVAPDPHAVITNLDLAGELTRENFGDVDTSEHFWFRARLVQRLAADSAHTVLFPRPELARDMSELVGIDITAHPERHTVVPEGIDLAVVDTAVAEAADHAAGVAATLPISELRELVSALPVKRRGLPLVVSVGRLHRVKGMAMIVDAWAGSDLRERCNLLIVGGNLDTPSADEREQLARIDATVPAHERMASGLILAGHRRNDTVARWIAASRFGLPGLSAPGGIYVCGSLKEEFGIALLEAMAAGLMVVAPDGGGPATYVRHGDTGFLTGTSTAAPLERAISAALAAVVGEQNATRGTNDRPSRSRATVADNFTIEAMATALARVYSDVHANAEADSSVLSR